MAYVELNATLPAQSAGGATSVTLLGDTPDDMSQATWQPGKLSLTSPSLVTGVATNFVTYNFRQIRAGASIGTIGTLALNAASVTLAAEVETNVPVTGTPIVVPGDVIDVQMVQSGTGLASPVGIVAKIELV